MGVMLQDRQTKGGWEPDQDGGGGCPSVCSSGSLSK